MKEVARDMKERMRADLRAAMAARRSDEARVIRGLIAALDNAEAPAAGLGLNEDGSAEIERLWLGEDDVARILAGEIEERERAAAEMEQLGRAERAALLRAEARVARRYGG